MKKFLVKGTVFIMLLCVLIAILNNGFYLNDKDRIHKFQNVPDGIEVCNIGASHSEYGFCWEDYQDEFVTFNFGLSNQSHYYDLQILEQYKEKLSENCVVFIVVSYPMLLYKNEINDEEFEYKNTRYYFFLPDESIKEFNCIKKIKTSFFPFVYNIKLSSLITSYFKKPIDKVWLTTATSEGIKKQLNSAFQRLVNDCKKDDNGKVIFSSEAVDSIYKMIECCNECGAKPILITPPFLRAYSEKVNNEFPEYAIGFKETVAKVQNDTGVAYFDYSMNERFLDNMEYFLNSDHLNKTGAKEFTKLVMEEIVKPYLNSGKAKNAQNIYENVS